jgi:Carbohydrate esterase, sialic acid-specific acetylesterase
MMWDPAKGEKPLLNKTGDWYAGLQYDEDTTNAKRILDDIGTYYPGADEFGYEIAGFFFFQGHKDTTILAHAKRYEENLVNFIHNIRRDFDVPSAPFVVASIGFYGYYMQDEILSVYNAQMAVDGDSGKYPLYEGNVKTIDTRKYWRNETMNDGGSRWVHYGFSGEFQLQVGEAMAWAMLSLL